MAALSLLACGWLRRRNRYGHFPVRMLSPPVKRMAVV
jgi:hypothetical protein